MTIAEDIVSTALTLDGVGAGTNKAEFLRVLGLSDPWVRHALAPPGRDQISCCGLVAEGVLRLAGVPVPSAWVPYAPRRATEYAIARADRWARQTGCRLVGVEPEPGDYVCIGSSIRTHALIAIRWEHNVDGTPALVSIDGGMQDDRGLQCVKLKRRVWHAGCLGDRRVNWIIRCGAA